MESWSREKIATCSFSERKYRHVHCPCLECRGSATDRNTELRHWRESQLLATEVESESSSFHEISGEIHVSTASCASPEPAEVDTPGWQARDSGHFDQRISKPIWRPAGEKQILNRLCENLRFL